MLSPVIKIIEEKCNNCHMCISVCPVKFCIDGSGDKVRVNHDLCIGCASCIDVCSQNAREKIDDTYEAFTAIRKREKVVAVAAPAFISSFDEMHRNVIGWLKEKGVDAVFDVSFGAELTVKSYLEFIKKNNPRMVIAQPCPTIVSYIEIYKPELLPMLAPADSPMLHTVKMIKTFYPEYRNHKVIVISPCISKRREFDATGYADFNVTIAELTKVLKKENVNLASIRPRDFDNPSPERAALFSSPGGLMKTVLREKPELEDRIRKIEGPSEIYDYLENLPKSLKKGTNPLIVDCLNCSKGCNGGPGTLNRDTPIDDLEHIIRSRTDELKKKYKSGLTGKTLTGKIDALLKKYWKEGLYNRSYSNKSGNLKISIPDQKQLGIIYNDLLKEKEEDFLNCAACGYNSCEKMAIAIFNNLNKAENCHHYKNRIIQIDKEKINSINIQLKNKINHCENLISDISNSLTMVNSNMDDQSSSLGTSSTSVEQMLNSFNSISENFSSQSIRLEELITKAQNGEREMKINSEAIRKITDDIGSIGKMIVMIDDISQRTNLLSMNAAIEAAHAGNTGRGFAVVASEIKKLAHNTAEKAKEAETSLKKIIKETNTTGSSYENTSELIIDIISNILELTNAMSNLLEDVNQLTIGSSEIMNSITTLKTDNQKVVDSTSKIGGHINQLHGNMSELVAIAAGHADD